MPNTTSAQYWESLAAELRTAIDAVVAALASGSSTVEYEIRNRRHKLEPKQGLLESLTQQLDQAERLAVKRSSPMFRVGRLSRPGGTG